MSVELQQKLKELSITNDKYIEYIQELEKDFNVYYNSSIKTFTEVVEELSENLAFKDFADREKFLIGVENVKIDIWGF